MCGDEAEAGFDDLKDGVKMVLITNASMFHRPHVQRGLEILDQNNGEIWAKLDAGTDEYYHLIERTPIPFRHSRKHHGGGAGSAAGDPIAVYAGERRTAEAGRARGVLRSA